MSTVRGGPQVMPAGVAGLISDPSVARLLIRTGGAHAVDLKALWRRLLGVQTALASGSLPLQVEVVAEQGRRLFVLRDPQGVVDMSLGAGTYDITVVRGSRRCRYTVPLAPGATFDLDLQDRPSL